MTSHFRPAKTVPPSYIGEPTADGAIEAAVAAMPTRDGLEVAQPFQPPRAMMERIAKSGVRGQSSASPF